MYPKYDTKWVEELPETCKGCGGEVIDNSFTDKKGKKWQSSKCEDCLIKYIKTQQRDSRPANKDQILFDEIKAINERISGLADFLTKQGKVVSKIEANVISLLIPKEKQQIDPDVEAFNKTFGQEE